jgi:hypothetical protein
MFGRRANFMEDDTEDSGIGSTESRMLEPLLSELRKHVKIKGIITLYSASYGPASWDVKKRPDGWAFGIQQDHTRLFPIHLVSVLEKDRVMALVLRSYTDRHDSDTGIRMKEIRGYKVWLDGGIHFEQIAAQDMVAMSRKDSFTGNEVDPEPAVVYCGPNGDRFDGWLRPR